MGATKLHYGEKYDDQAYNSILVPACAQAGIAAFTGDGTDPAVFTAAARAIGASGGKGIPTVKPWDRNTLFSKLDEAKAAGAQVIAMDIDAAGLPFLKGLQPRRVSKTVAELREIVEYAEVPFLIKGVMTVKGPARLWRPARRASWYPTMGAGCWTVSPPRPKPFPPLPTR